MKDILFVSATRSTKKDTDLYKTFEQLGIHDYHFFENNSRGLPEIYNSILDERRGRDEVVVFAHDDVAVMDALFKEKLNRAITEHRCSIVGLAGSAYFENNPTHPVTNWQRGDRAAWSGTVAHRQPDGSASPSHYGPAPRPCVVIDGLFIAVDNASIRDIRFDQRFNFHFYDLDFCLAAHRAGLLIGSVDINVVHRSDGTTNLNSFKTQQNIFREKWKPGIYVARQVMSRNSSCWCGSGERYKHCHGKLG